MQLFPNPKTFLQLGPLTIQWYAICIMTGALIAYLIGQQKFKKMGFANDILSDFVIFALFFGIIGGRIWYVIFMWDELYAANPIEAFMITNGGLAIQGGLFAGIAYGILYFRKKGIDIMVAGDVIMPLVLVSQACGRWGNFFNQEAHGGPVTLEFLKGLHLPQFIIDKMYIHGTYYHPTFLYESIGCIVGFILIYYAFDRFQKNQGEKFCLYFVWYGFIRYFIEGLRTDSLMVMGFRTAQLISIVFVIAGIIGFIYFRVKGKERIFKIETKEC